MEEWIGRKFYEWYEGTEDDNRKINYTLKTHYWGDYGQRARSIKKFTSDDIIDFEVRMQIQHSEISKAELKNNEWYFILDYYY